MEVRIFVRILGGQISTTSSIGGKSAVLSAITVVLGGKTASTGRGNGLKAFIREGQRYVQAIWTLDHFS
jgi:hypothetical protein